MMPALRGLDVCRLNSVPRVDAGPGAAWSHRPSSCVCWIEISAMRSLIDVSQWLVHEKPPLGASFATAIRTLQTAQPRDMGLLRAEYRMWLCEECPLHMNYHCLKNILSREIARQAQLVASGCRHGKSVDLRLIANIGAWAHEGWVFTHDSRYNLLGRAARAVSDGTGVDSKKIRSIATELGIGTRSSDGRRPSGCRVRGYLPDCQVRALIAESVVVKAVALQASEASPPGGGWSAELQAVSSLRAPSSGRACEGGLDCPETMMSPCKMSLPADQKVQHSPKPMSAAMSACEGGLDSRETMMAPCNMSLPADQKVQHSPKPMSAAMSKAASIVAQGEAATLADIRKAARGLRISVRVRIGKRKMEARRSVTKEKLLQQLTVRVDAARDGRSLP